MITAAALVRVSAAAEEMVAPPVSVARLVTVRVLKVAAPDTPRVPVTETPPVASTSKLVVEEMPMLVPVALNCTLFTDTYLLRAVAESEMVELVDEKVRGPVELEIVLPVVPNSVTVAAPVAPRVTAPVATKALFTVALVEERASRLVAPETPIFVPVALN